VKSKKTWWTLRKKCERTKVNAFYHVANSSATNLCLILDWFSYNVDLNWWLYHMIWKFWHFFGYSPTYPWIHMGPTVLPWVGGYWLTGLHITYENIFWCKFVHLTYRFFRVCGDKRSELFELFKKHDQLSSGATNDFVQLMYT
jgi:hypothetical protein